MVKMRNLRFTMSLLGLFLLSLGTVQLCAQSSKVMGEVRFEGDTQLDRDSGVWIDGNYVGYVKELKGDKKVLSVAGETSDRCAASRVHRLHARVGHRARPGTRSPSSHAVAPGRKDSRCHF